MITEPAKRQGAYPLLAVFRHFHMERFGVLVKKRFTIGTTVSLMALTAAVTFVITLSMSRKAFNDKITEVDRLADKYSHLAELDAKVRENFYTDVPDDNVLDGMLAGYVAGLGDRYSVYRSNREMTEYGDTNAGVYTGIGISVQQNQDGDVVIVSVSEGGSAEQAGIQTGDLLIEVEGISVKENYKEAIELIGGEIGTTVTVRVRKSNSEKEEKISLMRMQIDEITVVHDMLEGNIGYIRISKFRSVTVKQFENARQELLQAGAVGFIFDVRDNGGGVLSALEQMVDPMLPEGDLAFSYDKDGNASTILHSDADFLEMPYVVLVNGNTASASELFACVLRDYANAVLVGEKTFGKGIMQTTYELSDGGVTLTTATYATGVTPCYHGIGLEPDILSVYDTEAEGDTQLADAQTAVAEMIAEDTAA